MTDYLRNLKKRALNQAINRFMKPRRHSNPLAEKPRCSAGMGISRFVMMLSLLSLSACSFYQHVHDKLVAKQRCDQACQTHWYQCSRVCDQHSALCNAKADAIAAVHFNHYKRQQCVTGEGITLELNSFRDPLACAKTTCECLQDYDVCKQSCQGSIYKRLQPVNV
jgi:hypothetical protein